MRQAYYASDVTSFILTSNDEIIGKLNKGAVTFSTQYTRSTISWENSLKYTKEAFCEIVDNNPLASKWHILLEYELPRLGRRIDIVLLADDVIFVIEYKDERDEFKSAD